MATSDLKFVVPCAVWGGKLSPSFVDVPAVVFGVWAAHGAIYGESNRIDAIDHVVTHVPTGHSITSCSGVMTEEVARMVAQALDDAGIKPETFADANRSASRIRAIVAKLVPEPRHVDEGGC